MGSVGPAPVEVGPAIAVRRTPAPLLRAAAVFAILAVALSIWVAWHGIPLPGDIWLVHQLQRATTLGKNARIVNDIGNWLWLFVVAGVLLILLGGRPWRVAAIPPKREALAAMAAAIVLSLGDNLLKAALRSPRPSVRFGIHIEGHFSGYGYPSGHTYNDVLFFGVLAVMAPSYLPRRLVFPARLVSAAIILAAGPSRIVVGAHWPSDTLGGYLWAGAALCIALWFGSWVAGRR